jgi:hypothetical protein
MFSGAMASRPCFGHARPRGRGDRVDRDPVAAQLRGGHQRQRRDTGLGGRIVALPDAALQPGARTRVDDPGVNGSAFLGLCAPVAAAWRKGAKCPFEVDAEDGVPLVFTGVGQHAIPDEAGVVDQNVQPAEGVDGGLDQVFRSLPVGHIITIDDGFAAALIFSTTARAALALPGTVQRDADVVDHHQGTFGSEGTRVRLADAASRSGDDHHPAVEQSHPFGLPKRARPV